MPSHLDAVLWDMDGTLVDTEPYWFEAEKALVLSSGATWDPAIIPHLIGRPLDVSADLIREWFGLTISPTDLVDRMLDDVMDRMRTRGVPWRPGAHELLLELAAASVPCALVTMSWRRMAQIVLDELPPGTFDVVVTGDEVSNGKPHPEPYLKGADHLGAVITRCVAIEDSPTGIASAEAAGARVLAVQAHLPIPAAPGRSRVETLTGMSVADLEEIASGAVKDLLHA
ncbi:MAG: HAD family hydrolase [Beutenbergiaceae bacterium]